MSSKSGEKRTPRRVSWNSRPRLSFATTRKSPCLRHGMVLPLASMTESWQSRTLWRSSRRLCTCHVHPLSMTRLTQRETSEDVGQERAPDSAGASVGRLLRFAPPVDRLPNCRA